MTTSLIMSQRDGSVSARTGLSGTRKMRTTYTAPRDTGFLKLVERTEDAFATEDDSGVEEVRRILADVRSQYDQVHMDAEKKEAELVRLKEAIRVADASQSVGVDESLKKEDLRESLEKQNTETEKLIRESKESKKVYQHMLYRIQREQDLLQEKLLRMGAHLSRKSAEAHRKEAVRQRLQSKGVQAMTELDQLEQEVEHERIVREDAHKNLFTALQSKIHAKDRRSRFEEWRHEVALDAANEAFNSSAGRLRKLFAVEKLAGNALQKVTIEQVERSGLTEDGFQKIREVTGLADVMDIVHKFLNRDVEHEQLKSSVKEAEVRLETLREQFERFKRDTDGLTFDPQGAHQSRAMYFEVEEHEAQHNHALKLHEQSRQRLQQSTLQIEHMKRWANRMGRALSMFEDCVKVEKPADLVVFYDQMRRGVDKFIQHIVQQISSGKVQRKNMAQVASKEYHEASRLLTDKDFLKANCRVPASLDSGRPASRTGQGGTEDDSSEAHQNERERCKNESRDVLSTGTKKLQAKQQADHKKKAGANK